MTDKPFRMKPYELPDTDLKIICDMCCETKPSRGGLVTRYGSVICKDCR